MVGRKIRQIRQARGMSQQALAVALEVDKSTVGRWEQERGDTTVEMLRKIAAVLETPAAVFLEGDTPGLLAYAS